MHIFNRLLLSALESRLRLFSFIVMLGFLSQFGHVPYPQNDAVAMPVAIGAMDVSTTLAQTDADFLGWLDSVQCPTFRGWAGNTANPDLAIDVHFYLGSAESGGVFLGSTTANLPREFDVCEELGGTNCGACPTNQPQCNHGYEWTTPEDLLDGKSHSIFAYAINAENGALNQLLGVPKRFSCPSLTPQFTETWTSEETNNSSRSAWGDVDNDGDLDLVTGNTDGEPLHLYLNQGDGNLTLNWSPEEKDRTFSVAWGDMDNDGDLDLAVGNANLSDSALSHNRIYRNDGVGDNDQMNFILAWTSPESELSASLAWGDVDGDGDLDLAVGNAGIDRILGFEIPDGGVNRIYTNNGYDDTNQIVFTSTWTSAEDDMTSSVAWGDVDGDGDLDLAVGNGDVDIDLDWRGCDIDLGERNRIYLNVDGALLPVAVWESAESELTSSIAWADYDNDGDLDLAVGNLSIDVSCGSWGIDAVPLGHPNRIYRNENGMLMPEAVWSSTDIDATAGIAWGDFDNDGDPDLAVANTTNFDNNGSPNPESIQNRIYRNDGDVLSEAAAWESGDQEDTLDVAWGDFDNDGDLDIAVTNGNFDVGQQNHIYRNDSVTLLNASTWSSSSSNNTWALAWGDVDGDGDLDLALANGGRSFNRKNQLFLNEGGVLVLSEAAWNPQADKTMALAWGDVDGDGDLDLATGNYEQPDSLYRNENGILILDESWSVEPSATTAIVWGDVDGDGDLDLTTGGRGEPIRLFLNNGLAISSQPVWESSIKDQTWDIGWADIDQDGDLDLATVSKAETEPARIYLNESQQNGAVKLTPVWESPELTNSRKLAWGDVDGDGDLDLAVGNDGEAILIYKNSGGEFIRGWSSNETDQTRDLEFGDFDGDGDLDLVAVNELQLNRLYINQNGELDASSVVWAPNEAEDSESVAWGDVDNDGDLDLAVGNDNGVVHVYANPRHVAVSRQNDPSFALISRPGNTALAFSNSTAEILQSPYVTIEYTLFDAESDIVAQIFPEYSLDGGQHWQPATAVTIEDTQDLATAPWPVGVTHQFNWFAEADIIKNDGVVFRIRTRQFEESSPILWGSLGAQSHIFRVEAPWYIRVVDENGEAISGVPIYANGDQIVETKNSEILTDKAGLLNPGLLPEGTALVAINKIEEEYTPRLCHNNWAYSTSISNVTWEVDDYPLYETATSTGEQRLVINKTNPLVLFNIVVSIEWKANEAYISEIESAMQSASNYLYDLTDGQMAFGNVAIYSNKECWQGADIQISTENGIRPHAYIGTILTGDPSFVVRLGRGWDRFRNDSPWNASDGYRTIVHEFSHYAFHLFDEYEGYRIDQATGIITGIISAQCVGIENQNADNDATNASVMDNQFTSSEFAMRGVAGLWSEACERTMQFYYNEESDWETIVFHYKDSKETPERWIFVTPADRQMIFAGPNEIPSVLPSYPIISIYAEENHEPIRKLTVLNTQGEPISQALVTLFPQDGNPINQGYTDSFGQLDIYGATTDDEIGVITVDGQLQGRGFVTQETSIQITINTTARN